MRWFFKKTLTFSYISLRKLLKLIIKSPTLDQIYKHRHQMIENLIIYTIKILKEIFFFKKYLERPFSWAWNSKLKQNPALLDMYANTNK